MRGDDKMKILLKLQYVFILCCLSICFCFHLEIIHAENSRFIDIVNPYDGEGWQVDDEKNVTITQSGSYYIEGHRIKTQHMLIVEENIKVTLVFSGVYIEAEAFENHHAVCIKDGSTVYIDFMDDTTLIGTGKLSNGIYVGKGTDVRISNTTGKGTFKLKGADSGGYGIGCQNQDYYGSIIFSSGHIIAEAGTGTESQKQGLELFDTAPAVAIGASNVNLDEQTIIKITGNAHVVAYGGYAATAIGFAGGVIDYTKSPPADFDDKSTWTKDTFVTDSVQIEIGENATVLAYGGAGSPGIGAYSYSGVITIKNNAHVVAYGGDGKKVLSKGFLMADSVLPGGAGIGSGGMVAMFNGVIHIKDQAIVKAYGGKGVVESGYDANNISFAGPGIGWAGQGTLYSYPSYDDDSTWAYLAPIDIHGYGIYAKGGEESKYHNITTGTGDAIGQGGSYYNDDGTIITVPPDNRISGRSGKMRSEIKMMTYHFDSISSQNCTLYTSADFILPPTSYLAEYESHFPNQRYTEWSEDSDANSGMPEGNEYTGDATNLYMVQNPILYESSLTENSQNIPLQGKLVLKFNKTMNSSEFGTILLKNQTDGSHIQIKEGIWSENDMTLTVVYNSLKPNSTYELEVEGFKDTKQVVMRGSSSVLTTVRQLDVPIKANPIKNEYKIEGRSSYAAGHRIMIYAFGERQDAIPSMIGDERYIPLDAIIEELNLKVSFDNSDWLELTIDKAGDYVVKIRYQLQCWDGVEWKDVSDSLFIQYINLNVNEKNEISYEPFINHKVENKKAAKAIETSDQSHYQLCFVSCLIICTFIIYMFVKKKRIH